MCFFDQFLGIKVVLPSKNLLEPLTNDPTIDHQKLRYCLNLRNLSISKKQYIYNCRYWLLFYLT